MASEARLQAYNGDVLSLIALGRLLLRRLQRRLRLAQLRLRGLKLVGRRLSGLQLRGRRWRPLLEGVHAHHRRLLLLTGSQRRQCRGRCEGTPARMAVVPPDRRQLLAHLALARGRLLLERL